jgi:predicted RNase H-like nuclease (RuvC/YqgF family)
MTSTQNRAASPRFRLLTIAGLWIISAVFAITVWELVLRGPGDLAVQWKDFSIRLTRSAPLEIERERQRADNALHLLAIENKERRALENELGNARKSVAMANENNTILKREIATLREEMEQMSQRLLRADTAKSDLGRRLKRQQISAKELTGKLLTADTVNQQLVAQLERSQEEIARLRGEHLRLQNPPSGAGAPECAK